MMQIWFRSLEIYPAMRKGFAESSSGARVVELFAAESPAVNARAPGTSAIASSPPGHRDRGEAPAGV